jgi:hypothetical protein
LAFGLEIDKDVVRRLLSIHYRPESGSAGPSWLTFLGHTKDSLWSCDLFRCESATLRTYCCGFPGSRRIPDDANRQRKLARLKWIRRGTTVRIER